MGRTSGVALHCRAGLSEGTFLATAPAWELAGAWKMLLCAVGADGGQVRAGRQLWLLPARARQKGWQPPCFGTVFSPRGKKRICCGGFVPRGHGSLLLPQRQQSRGQDPLDELLS